MKLSTHIEHRRRIRASVEYLAASLKARPDGWAQLSELADAAHLSPYHYLRLYRHAVGETPQVTQRRLKLALARQSLQTPSARVIDVALAHGYESAQAFSRAYRAQFGVAPTEHQRVPACPEPSVRAWVAHVPTLAMQMMPLGDAAGDAALVFDEFMACLDLADVPRHGQDMFCIISPEGQLEQGGALQNRWVNTGLRLARRVYGDSLHLCLCGQPDAVWKSLKTRPEFEWRHGDRPLLMRYLNDPAYKPREEQCIELYVPLKTSLPLRRGRV